MSERWNCNKSAQLGSMMGQLVGLIVELSEKLYLFKKILDNSALTCYAINITTKTLTLERPMNLRQCVHCECDFNLDSPLKRRVGGRINECPDCVEELQTEIKETIRAVSSGDGKMACIQILKFQSEDDAELYRKGWDQWSGWNNQRSGSVHDIAFTKVGENAGNGNHKGKVC